MEDVRIESIETIPIKVDLPRRYSGSYYSMRRRCTIITRVHTSAGIVGEAYNADTDEEQADIVRIIEDELAPLLKGRDAMRIESRWHEMYRLSFDQLRDRRLVMQAIACVDTALWDAWGKVLGQPLYRLWGGYRDAIPMIGIGGYYEQPNWDGPGLEDEVEFFAELGVVGMKFKIGGSPPAEDADRLARAVKAAPDGFEFVVDANQGYTYAEALSFTRRCADFVQLRWFEEPCRWDNDGRSMRDLRLATGVPVAAGQSEISAAGIRDLVARGSVDVCNFDASLGGGPTEWRRAAAMSSLYGVEMGHHEEGHLAAHLMASIPHGTFVEAFHPERDPIFWHMLANRPDLRDGSFPLPQGPGLGWELDSAFMERHRVS